MQSPAPSLLLATVLLACGSDAGTAPLAGGLRAAAQASGLPSRERAPASAPVAPAAQGAVAAARPPSTGSALRIAGGGPEHDFVLEHLARARALSFSPVSASGTVLRVRLAAPFDAAFKPATPEESGGPNAEVAAYRLARCLGMDSVPPAMSRDIPAAEIRAGLPPDAKQSWRELRARLGVGDDGTVRGAVIYWIPQLADLGIDRRDGLRRIGEWLRVRGELPEGSRSLAAALSAMLAFDYLVGNFDRWSGGNVSGDARATLVYVRDHDLAFPRRMTEKLHRRLWDDLHHAQRFSRRFYAAVKALTREAFERELARDPKAAARPLLGPRQIRGVFDRREALISYVESLIAEHGEHEVLYFE